MLDDYEEWQRNRPLEVQNAEGRVVVRFTPTMMQVDLSTIHGVRAARALAYSLMAAGLDKAADFVFACVGR